MVRLGWCAHIYISNIKSVLLTLSLVIRLGFYLKLESSNMCLKHKQIPTPPPLRWTFLKISGTNKAKQTKFFYISENFMWMIVNYLPKKKLP